MTKSIQKVLVANRGEIARRVMRTCREMGIRTVAVFSDADEAFPFVREADEAVRLGRGPSAESYLVIEKVIEAARKTGADAIHPGYGFLAENANFARACDEAGLIFIGPSAEAIASMGSKREAKALVSAAGVPTIPGYDGADQAPEVLAAEAIKVGFPVLLKASAGGGGKGMRVVYEEAGLSDAIASARREAESSFADGTLLVEKYIERPRHVEVQILGDTHGGLVHLFERECSIQRRHQKIIEEAPSPAISQELRELMGRAAVRAAQAISYHNAGTVEFILDPDGDFFFLEVNTRLQVEHPVTECITGLDLVHEQIRIAEGEPLRFTQKDLEISGAAIEVRIYAEDPSQGFLPDSGEVVDWHIPERPGLRVDAGVETGSVVGIHYDPMLAKLITNGADRREAIQRMCAALRELSVQGLRTNREFLLEILAHPEFIAGALHTHFVDEQMDLAPPACAEALERALIAAVVSARDERLEPRSHVAQGLSGWRNNDFAPQRQAYSYREAEHVVEYRVLNDGVMQLAIHGEQRRVHKCATRGRDLQLEVDGHRYWARVIAAGERTYVQTGGAAFALGVVPRFPDSADGAVSGGCIAPMPGKIVEVRAEVGAKVGVGDVLVIMEAMKMEHKVCAATDGLIEEVRVAVGDQVEADALLVVVGESD